MHLLDTTKHIIKSLLCPSRVNLTQLTQQTMKTTIEPLLIQQFSFLPLGNLSRILQAWIQFKDLIIQ